MRGLDYEKFRKQREEDARGYFVSFADLFALLSFVFLFLFLLGTIREGVLSIAGRVQDQSAQDESKRMLQDTVTAYEKRIAEYEAAKTAASDEHARTRTQLEELKHRQEKLRTDIADRLRQAFKAGGIKADVDRETGEVMIPFAEVYFDYGSHALKPEMKKVLRQVIPVYARTLLSEKVTRGTLASLEVLGFASPTYKGKYVDPSSLDARGRKSVSYNMDLSYKRAKAIFEFIFDRSQFKFPLQSSMLGITTVSGLGYLQADKVRGPAAQRMRPSLEAFCKRYGCASHQKVILRFNLKDNPEE